MLPSKLKNYKQVHECAFGRPAPLIFSDIFVTETERKVFKDTMKAYFCYRRMLLQTTTLSRLFCLS